MIVTAILSLKNIYATKIFFRDKIFVWTILPHEPESSETALSTAKQKPLIINQRHFPRISRAGFLPTAAHSGPQTKYLLEIYLTRNNG
jgi:hypothetical protein